MTTLALALIAKNEEHNLPRCLESVKGLCDQIIVIDTGSTDRTAEIAKSYGAEVHFFKWIDDFSAARNFSFSFSKCDYTFWLDADDEILPDCKQTLLDLKRNMTANAYLLRYIYSQDANGNPTATVYNHRIVRNNGEATWRYPIHECLTFPPSWHTITLKADIIHRRSQEDAKSDNGRNIRILEKAIAKQPDDPRLKYYYAKELFSEARTKEAIAAFDKYFKTGGSWHDDDISAYLMWAIAYCQIDKFDEAIDRCMLGIKRDPRRAEFFMTIGQIHYTAERWGQAIPWFEIAKNLPQLDTLGQVITENYTWAPLDRLCKCYSATGLLKEAYEANEKCLVYQPNEKRFLFNRELLRNALYPGRDAPRPIRLSLGSGGKSTFSYRCTDLYPLKNVEEAFDQCVVPYLQATVHAIYSEHALEHSAGHRAAENAIAEWSRVLRHGGHVTLKLPDLDLCCEAFFKSEDRPRQPGERWTQKEWFRYTIYGIQESQNNEPDEGQYHRTGFTKSSIKSLLEKNGFEVQSIANYDGYGTPSMEVKAVQLRQPMKIAWLIPGPPDENHGSLRIRRLNIHRWLCANGVDSKIIDYKTDKNALDTARYADVCVFIAFGPEEQELIEQLKRRGVKCVFDHCEDLHNLPGQTECFGACDVVVCCSTVLADRSAQYGRTVVIQDAYEVFP